MLENRFLYWMDKAYGLLIKIGSNLQSLFLLYMRMTWGHQFVLSGVEKIKNFPDTIAFFTKLGLPHPEIHAYLVAHLEAIGGILLFIGFASRLISIPLTIILITALTTAHAENLANFSFILDPKSLAGENPYPFLITTLLVFIFGPGRVSIDAWIRRWVNHQPRY
ncbi:MAG: DoxX family protein [Parachlamydiales bacterium]|nr:DoxX family protein [Parachlamydiales bacterium]